MLLRFFKRYWLHILLWGLMAVYFITAPGVYARVFLKAGKPIPTDSAIPPESNRISFVVEGLEPYTQDGQSLHNLYGRAYIAPEQGQPPMDGFVREITLISDDNTYVFFVKSVHRDPGLQDLPASLGIDLDTLGFSAAISKDVIKPGTYRIGVVFRNPSTGEAYYGDKPAHYLVRTANTFTLK